MNIYIFGDSHARSFTTEAQITKGSTTIKNCCKDSITIRGLNNERSTTNYGEYLLQTLRNIEDKKNAVIVLKLGQVDVEYSFHFKTIIKNEAINLNSFFEEIINIYAMFINRIRAIYNFKIVICSINLPNYCTNDYFHSCLSYLFKLMYMKNEINITPDQLIKINAITVLDQTNNVIEFNKRLDQFCNKNNLIFLDTTAIFLDNETKILKTQYMGVDQHYLDVCSGSKDGIVQNIFQQMLLKKI